MAYSGGALTLEVRDFDTGEVMPARVSMQVGGNLYPGDRIGNFSSEWPNIDAHGVFIDGRKTFQLPTGPIQITVAHGAEYHTAATNLTMTAKDESVVLHLRRFINMRELGWVCGDAHMHMIHGARKREVTFDDVALSCNAGGLDFAYVNQGYVGAGTLDLEGYNAECERVSTEDFKLFIGGERPKSLLGHSAVIGVPNPFLVRDDPPYHIGAREVHRQGGVLYYVHPIRYFPGKQWNGEWLDFPGNNMARSLVFDMHLGPSFDALSVLSDEPNKGLAHQLWFNLLNRGYFVPVMADSDAVFDRPVLGKSAPGFWMSYVHIGIGEEAGHATIAKGIREGRSFASTGPILLVDVNGQLSGNSFALGDAKTMRIRAWHPHNHWSLKSGSNIERVELIENGQVIKTWAPSKPHIELEHELKPTDDSWYVVRVYGNDKRWQTAMCSPFYFSDTPRQIKQPVTMVEVRGRIYDFKSGVPLAGVAVVRRGEEVLQRRSVESTFSIDIPLDATVEVEGSVRHDLLLGYQPVHQFLWNLEAQDLGKSTTMDAFDRLIESVELEFPVNYVMGGSFVLPTGNARIPIEGLELKSVPDSRGNPGIYAATVILDTVATVPGDTINGLAVFHWNGEAGGAPDFRLSINASGYDPSRPSGYNALKRFDKIEQGWSDAVDLGDGYRLIRGSITIPEFIQSGPMNAIDIGVRARSGNDASAFIGLEIPLEDKPRRALSVSTAWPTMPMSWHDHNYGIGPTKICHKLGRKNRPPIDYRQMHFQLLSGERVFDVNIPAASKGCADSEDAVYTGQFLDQVLSQESGIGSE